MTEERAETLAEHLERVQWRVRTTSVIEHAEACAPDVDVSSQPFACLELQTAIRALKSGKATRAGDLPIEFYKALADEPGDALDPLLSYLNDCLANCAFPQDW